MAELPPVRRLVTGHTADGKAIVDSDTLLHPVDPHASLDLTPATNRPEKGGGFILLWKTNSFPAKLQDSWSDLTGQNVPLADPVGTTVRIVDMPPGLSSPMHRTVSLDFGVVLKGEVVLELDDGVESLVKEGEVVVQRGTIHAWHNRTGEMTRVLFVLVPSEKVLVPGKRLEATKFEIN
jgi:quercetin dioxygenase-like cupin family protein